jgi:hypothetical protein
LAREDIVSTGTADNGKNQGRVPVPDPALMRRSTSRILVALIAFLLLSSFFTVGGISLVAAGELPGLPLAVGGAVVQLAVLAIVLAGLRVRSTLTGGTVSRVAVSAALRTLTIVRIGTVTTIFAAMLYAIARAIVGDRWTLLTAAIMAIILWATASSASKAMKAYKQIQALS